MFKNLIDIIKNLEGNVLTIGVDSKLLNSFSKNSNINVYSIEDNSDNSFFKKSYKKRRTNKGKNINIKKLRKYFNKKKTDYVICNLNSIFDYYKYIIKDMVYINSDKLYMYSTKDINYKLIINNYKRYTNDIEVKEYKDTYLIIINNKNTKNNYIKDKIYFIKDTLYNISEKIGNILAS